MSDAQSVRQPRQRIVVVGGGITGLAAAHRLIELDPQLDVQLHESTNRLGGVLQTVRDRDYLIETSADNFITNVPWGVDLCRRVGLEPELIQTREAHRQALVLSRGRLHKVPNGFVLMSPTRMWPILASGLLSPLGKLRLLGELFVSPGREPDESLASFARRRFGREVFERLVQPLIGGIYTADPEKLSLAATLPRFLEMERNHGSLIRAAKADRAASSANSKASGARYSLFVTPRDGMTSLIERVAAKLPGGSIKLQSAIDSISSSGDKWKLQVKDAAGHSSEVLCDAVILATPANRTSAAVANFDASLSQLLAQIPYAGTAIAILGYRRDQIRRPVDAFGFVVPEVERRHILAASFSSIKYPGRAAEDRVLVRVFMGGACNRELLDQSDAEMLAIAHEELADILTIEGSPELSRLTRWTDVMPQYHVGHLELVSQIETATARWPGLQLAGNAYRGVGIPHCIRSGEQAAEKIIAQLQKSQAVTL